MEILSPLNDVAGLLVICAGLAQIFMKKGGGTHALIGFIYLVSLLIVAVSGSMMKDMVIISLGWFAFYMAFSGWRLAFRRRTRPKQFERIMTVMGLMLALFCIVLGVLCVLNKKDETCIVLIFSSVFLAIAVMDIILVRKHKHRKSKKTDPVKWVVDHFTRMYASYILAFTTFTVSQDMFRSAVLNWLAPLIIGAVFTLISRKWHGNRYLEKFKRHQA